MAKKKTKKIWMTAAEIPANTLLMMSEPCRYFLKEWPKKGLGPYIRQYFTHFVGDFSRMHFIRKEFDQNAEFLANKMIKRPVWVLGIISRVERWSKQFMCHSDILRRAPLPKLSDRELTRLYKNCVKYQRLQHGIGSSVAWQADADKERVTKAIWNLLEQHLKKVAWQAELADIFSILTTPQDESLAVKEEKDFLRIAQLINRKPAIKKIFLKRDMCAVVGQLKLVDIKLHRRILKHHQKYCWLVYQYKGPATPLGEYIGRWQELFKNKAKPQIILKKIQKDSKKLYKNQQQLIKQIKLTPYLKKIVTMAQRLVYIKDFRKYALYHGMYCYDPLFREIGKRLGLTINQIWAMNTWDIPDLLLKKKFDINELNARQKTAVAYSDKKHYVIYTGEKASHFLRAVVFEKVSNKKINELHGTPACSGKAVGTVKVINIPEQMKKMKKGDIMVAHNTNPNLVPAMKKAAALVSEAGGLTCHTAIVARELRIPSVVGVAGADKTLKDGDRIEVDANKGVIKRI